MAGVHIVTDSSCDLPQSQVDGLGVTVIPLSIRFGSEEFADGVELSVEEFYRRLASSAELPETAAPSPARSRRPSGQLPTTARKPSCASTCRPSCRPRCRRPRPEPAPSPARSTSGSSTRARSRWVSAPRSWSRPRPPPTGAAPTRSRSSWPMCSARTRVYGALDTLENLKKGGRIGGAQALLGNLLSVKPILDISSGAVEEAAKTRTRRKALQWLADKVLEQPVVERLCVVHGHTPDVDEMLDLLSPRYSRDELMLGVIGPVIGTHGGPRVMGVTYQVPR